MKKILKKTICGLVMLVLTLAFFGCEKNVEQDDSQITMFVGLGNNQAYYEALHELVEEKLGIDIKFVYQTADDVSNAVKLQFKNNDLCADIMVTASMTPNEYLEDTCIDFLDYSKITDAFTYSKIKEYTAEDGGVYQLPFTSRLIGITYNKTLLKELGCELPKTFSDLLDIKAKCDEKGVEFAVSGGVATGHGFNYLMHIEGTDFLSTLEGTEWFEGFVSGEKDVSEFAEAAEYFKKFVDAGLFGKIHDEDWYSAKDYKESRALFYFNITHDVSEDEGGDEYGLMPWISEDGSSNNYTCYDNMFLSLSNKLTAADQKDRLEKCIRILELMTTEEATKIFTDMYPDGYIAVNNFTIDESKVYYEYAESVQNGNLQPWYYTSFDATTITNVGELVNEYIKGESNPAFQGIIDELEACVGAGMNSEDEIIGNVDNTLGCKELAELEAMCGALNLDEELSALGYDCRVQVSLLAYTENAGDLVPWGGLGVVNTKLYAGVLQKSYMGTILATKAKAPIAIEMTGAEIKALIASGLDKSMDNGYDGEKYGPYPYAVWYSDGNSALDDNSLYVVAINESNLTNEQYRAFSEEGRILLSTEDDSKPGKGNLSDGIIEYFKNIEK